MITFFAFFHRFTEDLHNGTQLSAINHINLVLQLSYIVDSAPQHLLFSGL